MAMNALHQTSLSFIGQNYGAGEKKRILRVLLLCQAIVVVVGVVLGNAAVIFGRPLLHIYSDNPEVVEAGLVRLKYICRFYVILPYKNNLIAIELDFHKYIQLFFRIHAGRG